VNTLIRHDRLDTILQRAEHNNALTYEEIRFLLSISEASARKQLFAAARRIRERHFGNRVFLYGFLYFNTACCNDCLFCNYRKSNTSVARYRKSSAEITDVIEELKGSGVHLVDLTMGEIAEDRVGAQMEYSRLISAVRLAQQKGDVPVMVSPGVVPPPIMEQLAEAGATWYACYQETYNRSLFSRIRVSQDYDTRMAAKKRARKRGMLIEEGMLIGIGESLDDRAENIAAMRRLGADQIRVMTLVPQPGTPMAHLTPLDDMQERIAIAVMRLAMPDRLIPASLDVGGLAGLRNRLDAGANVVSSLVIPGRGLAGVANHALDIEQARRTPTAIEPILSNCRLESASLKEYRSWIAYRKNTYSATRKVA